MTGSSGGEVRIIERGGKMVRKTRKVRCDRRVMGSR